VEVLERYLQAVRHWLPSGPQDDILAELAEDIRSQVEEREAAAGRPLSEAELTVLVQGRGHPMWVAEAYLPQRHLIGPPLLPVYSRVVKVSLVCLAAIFAVLYAVFAFVVDVPPRPELASAGFWLWYACLYGFAYVGFLTALFALIERSARRARAGDAWDPRDPHALPSTPGAPAAGERVRLRVNAAGRALGAALFALWWLDVLRLDPLPGVTVALTPVWDVLHWPILAVALATAALAGATVARPHRGRTHAALGLACAVGGTVVTAVLLSHAGRLVEIAVSGAPAAGVSELARWANVSVAVTVAVFAVSYLLEALRDLQAVRGRPAIRLRPFRLLTG
jgi:hypothetical protein